MDKEEIVKLSEAMIANHKANLSHIRGILYRSSHQIMLNGRVTDKSSQNLTIEPLSSEIIEEIIDGIEDIIDDLQECNKKLTVWIDGVLPPTS